MDHPGVHPPTGVALLHVGGARRHVAPGTRGRPHRDRGGNRPGPTHLAGRTGLPLAQAPGRPPSGTRGGGAQPRGTPPTAPRQEGTPLPADGHGPGRPARLRVAVGRRGGATAAGPLGPPVVVSAHASRVLSRGRSSPAWPCSAACRRGPHGYGGRKEAGARAPISPWSRAKRCSTPREWGPWNGGRWCPARRAGGSQRPPHSPCGRRRRATASYGWSPLWPPNTPLRGTCGRPY